MATTAVPVRLPRPSARSAYVLRARSLPGPARATAGAPWMETATCAALVPALFAPVLLATGVATPAILAAAAATAGVALLFATQRVVVGDDFVAVRRLARFRVLPAGSLRGMRARPSQRGGTVVLDVAVGRSVTLRHVEAAHLRANEALCDLARRHAIPLSEHVTRIACTRRSVDLHRRPDAA